MIRRSLVYSLLDRYSGVALNLGTMAIVSRLMTPAEIGLFLVVSSVVILTEAFRDFGIGTCIVQEPDLSPRFVQTAFTTMACLSAILSVSLFAVAEPVAAFYGEELMAPMIRLATLSFVLAPFSNPLLALMRRDMAFDRVARISIASAATNSAATVLLALAGAGPMSFIYGSVLAATVMTAGAVWARPDFWVFRLTFAEARRVVPFGAWSSLVTILIMGYDFMPRLLLGRLLGLEVTGLYGRAVSLCQLPEKSMMNALQPVLMSAMAARVRGNDGLREPYLVGLANLSALQWPALVCLAILAEPIVLLLLGQQWLEAVPLVRLIALASLLLLPVHLAPPVLVAVGRVREMALLSALTLPAASLILLAAAQISLAAVAWSMFLIAPLHGGAALLFARRHIAFGVRDLAGIAASGLLVVAGAGLAPMAFLVLVLHADPINIPALALAVTGSAAGWLAGLRLSRHPFGAEVRRILPDVRTLLFRRSMP
jgi:O-antigen/teichoic acid export membrane protein